MVAAFPTHPGRAALLGLLLGLACACRTQGGPTPAAIEATLRREARNVVRDGGIELYSPYDAELTEAYGQVVREEARLVRSLLADEHPEPLRLYLVPTSANGEVWEHSAREGREGGAFAQGFAFVYVPRTSSESPLRLHFERATLRHELTHLSARRCGLARGKWFSEGLAREVESMSPVEGELRAHPFPSALVGARQAGRAGWLDELLAWRPDAALDLDELAERYDGSQALLRFLLAREPGSAWPARLRAVHARSDAHIAALEPEWLAWLGSLDALAVIGERTRAGAERERARAAALLPILAERGAPELATRAADELALDLLADPACRAAAATFLLFFRAAALDPVDLARLESSDDASQVLTAQALRARRRETPDMDAARSAWFRLTELERISCATEAALLPGLVEGR